MSKVQRDVRKIAKYTVNGEQIEAAFNLLNDMTAKTRRTISVDPFDSGAQEITLDNLAKALLVIQSFYSNTNWVEMNGDVHSPAFGGEGGLTGIVPEWKETCNICDPRAKYDCVNNIVTTKLTSGFRSDQDIKIPHLNRGLKCAHDWNTDNNKLAIGGIGKDTTDSTKSPHADFHPEAAIAAIQATTVYLYQNGKGVLSTIPIDNFLKLFDLSSRKKESKGSLAFILDVSGSMSEDIQAARDACINMVTAVQGTPNEPADYVLATFNDPESLTTGERFTNGNDMINKLHSLKADGGEDCPEYALSGILRGLSLSKSGSKFFAFTDADAKDASKWVEVNTTANALGIAVNFLLTGECRRRRATDRVKRDVDDVYIRIAAATGGKVYNTPKSELPAILDTIMHEELPSSDVVIKVLQMVPSNSNWDVIVVDPTISLLKIVVTGGTSVEDITIEDPNGSTLQYEAGAAIRYFNKGQIIISVQKPLIGNWTIIQTTAVLMTAHVMGSSPLDFTFQVTEQEDLGVSYFTEGNLIKGQNYTLSTKFLNLAHNSTLQSVSLVNIAGKEIVMLQTSLRRMGTELLAVVDFTMPDESVRIQVTGVLPGGEYFQRTNLQVISPVNVKLRLITNLESFPFNKPINITYQLESYGSINQTLLVDIDTDFGRLPTASYTVSPGEVNEYNFEVTGKASYHTMRYTVSVREIGLDVIEQSLSGTAWFEDPVCDVISNYGACPETVNSPVSCQSFTWLSQAVFSAEVTSYRISANNSIVQIAEFDTTLDGKVYVNVSGDCCSPSVYLNTFGSDDLMNGQCEFNFGSIPTITIKGTTPTEFSTNWTTFGCVFGAVVICLIIFGILALWCRKRTGKLHITDFETM
ncbi:von Willebrand factor A domain-containing protein 7-like [Ylistrum balloti]|uniref:von Willebrand factor A domain-containing protein 7-like n=1 Tax=Ylistrum balloti TaxID=509963 RepID=UPI002905A155|nr:von Willebrand factor A domain-containing protein 7-like [Ylistrum balloti]